MAHPLDHPLVHRISHWINLINFIFLIITGFMIHSPYPGEPVTVVRNIHFIFAYILIINGIVRFYYSFLGKYKDYDSFILNKQDIKNIWPQVKYYLFVGKHPNTRKYNPLQMLAYIALYALGVLQAITGVILYKPELYDRFLSFVTGLTGFNFLSYIGTLADIRVYHYLIMWLFIVIVAIHVYLVFTTAFEQFFLMFFGKVKSEKGN